MLIVFGSINLDIAFSAARLPAPGETVLGKGYLVSPGGKGANQAHAAQRYGMKTALVGAVGEDSFAEPALAQLARSGVDLSALQRLAGSTGCAGIVVDAQGENQIVVAPGVNLALRNTHLGDAMLGSARAVLLQMETDARENHALIARAHKRKVLTVLNNAPAREIPEDVLASLDVLIVNQTEFAQTAQAAGIAEDADTGRRVLALARRFDLSVVVTLGAGGAMAVVGSELLQCPAPRVQAVDATGAGDTFAGVLVSALIEDRRWPDALARACAAAALACTQPGAQVAQPGREQIEAMLARP